MKRILFLSNGHGEDAIGAVVARAIKKERPQLEIEVFPLVGLGGSYQKAGFSPLAPCLVMPSGGFVVGLPAILRDIRAGLPKLVWKQMAACRRLRKRAELTVAVGDIFPLFLGSLLVRRPLVFLPTAKSGFIGRQSFQEKYLMKKYALRVFPRDEETAEELRKEGIRAEFLGNVMMDCLSFSGKELFTEGGKGLSPKADFKVVLLPGSREEAYRKICPLLETVEVLFRKGEAAGRRLSFVLAKAPSVDGKIIVREAEKIGWREETVAAPWRYLKKGRQKVAVVEGFFGDILKDCQVVIGLAGTANEQAVGMGKMVVAFPGRGPQITARYLEIQSRLLGGAVKVVPPQPPKIAEQVWNILLFPERYASLMAAGKQRMGPAGGGDRIAQEIVALVSSSK